MSDKIVWYGFYEAEGLKDLCKKVRTGDEEAIKKSAKLLSEIIPFKAVIVAMPGHPGRPTYMFKVVEKIAEYREDVVYCSANALRSNPHKPLYLIKRKGGIIPNLHMVSLIDFGKMRNPICIIDNVYDTGVNARAALKAIPNARVFVLAKTLHPYKKGK